MSEMILKIGVDSVAQAEIGGGTTATIWLSTKGSGSTIVGRAKADNVEIKFATSGTYANPGGWTDGVNLSTADTEIPAQYLADAIDANIQAPPELNNVSVVIVKSSYSAGSGQFEAKVNNNYENYWFD